MLTIAISVIYVCARLFYKKDKTRWDNLSTGTMIGIIIAYLIMTYLGGTL